MNRYLLLFIFFGASSGACKQQSAPPPPSGPSTVKGAGTTTATASSPTGNTGAGNQPAAGAAGSNVAATFAQLPLLGSCKYDDKLICLEIRAQTEAIVKSNHAAFVAESCPSPGVLADGQACVKTNSTGGCYSALAIHPGLFMTSVVYSPSTPSCQDGEQQINF